MLQLLTDLGTANVELLHSAFHAVVGFLGGGWDAITGIITG